MRRPNVLIQFVNSVCYSYPRLYLLAALAGCVRRRFFGKKSLAGVLSTMAVATLLSEVFDYLRQSTILAVFGTGQLDA